MNYFVNCAIFTAIGFTLGCSQIKVAAQSVENHQLFLTAVNPEVDLGLYPARVEREVRFEVQNQSDRPIRILAVKGSCSCTSVTSTSTEIQPRSNATVIALISPRDGSGDFRVAVHVDYSVSQSAGISGDTRRLNLTVRGVTFDPGKIKINPSVIELGDQSPGSHFESHVTISQEGGLVLSSEMFEVITPSWISSEISRLNQRTVLNLFGSVPKASGLFVDSIQLKCRSGQYENVRIPVSGYIVGVHSVRPRSIVHVVQNVDDATFEAQVENTNKKDVLIGSVSIVEVMGGAVGIDQSKCINGIVTLQLRPKFEKDSIAVRGRVIIQLHSKGAPEVLSLPFLFIRRRGVGTGLADLGPIGRVICLDASALFTY